MGKPVTPGVGSAVGEGGKTGGFQTVGKPVTPGVGSAVGEGGKTGGSQTVGKPVTPGVGSEVGDSVGEPEIAKQQRSSVQTAL